MNAEKQQNEPIARKLATFAHNLKLEDVPMEVQRRAKHLMLDAIGIAFASHRNEFSGVMMNGIRALEEGGASPVIGSDETFTVRNAVMMNAGLMHGLDYDDTHMKGIVHATAFCAPTALGVAHQVGQTGKDALAAYIAGMEVAIRIGAAAKGGFHHAGFHPTGVLAHSSAALIAGRFYGLTVEQLAAAQGIAASTAAAVQVFLEEGTWSKRLHPGWGGVGGITAARLAQAGFLAPTRPYEGRYGLFESHLQERAATVDYAMITDGLGEVWEVPEMAIKPYPVCHFIHSLAEAASDLSAMDSFKLDDITRIRAFIPEATIPLVTEPLEKKRRPTTNYEAKFSAQYVTAASLVRGGFGLEELEPDALADETILSLSERVECLGDPESMFPTYFSGGVIVNTRDGKEHKRYYRINKGAGERALSNAQIVDKYMGNARWALPEHRVVRVRDVVLNLEKHGSDEIWAELAGKSPSK
jgi:2-methylcitrate dehydratase PrpD